MKIIHFSDWHGNWRQLPPADIYVSTGDMLPNFVVESIQYDKWDRNSRQEIHWNVDLVGEPREELDRKRIAKNMGFYRLERRIIPEREREYQTRWCKLQGSFRKYLGSPEAPVLIVGGNHDFIPIAEYFGGEVHEFDHDASRTYRFQDHVFAGVTGVPPINGEWNHEVPQHLMKLRIEPLLRIPFDFLITHSPPNGILDHYDGEFLGCPVLEQLTYEHPPRAHFFGHIHNMHGTVKVGDTVFLNAATTELTIEI